MLGRGTMLAVRVPAQPSVVPPPSVGGGSSSSSSWGWRMAEWRGIGRDARLKHWLAAALRSEITALAGEESK